MLKMLKFCAAVAAAALVTTPVSGADFPGKQPDVTWTPWMILKSLWGIVRGR